MRDFDRGVSEGLARAAAYLFGKSIDLRMAKNVTANTMANIFEDLAKEILDIKERL